MTPTETGATDGSSHDAERWQHWTWRRLRQRPSARRRHGWVLLGLRRRLNAICLCLPFLSFYSLFYIPAEILKPPLLLSVAFPFLSFLLPLLACFSALGYACLLSGG